MQSTRIFFVNKNLHLLRQFLPDMPFEHTFGIAHHLPFEFRILPALLNELCFDFMPRNRLRRCHMPPLYNSVTCNHQSLSFAAAVPIRDPAAAPTVAPTAAPSPSVMAIWAVTSKVPITSVPPATFSRSSSDSSFKFDGAGGMERCKVFASSSWTKILTCSGSFCPICFSRSPLGSRITSALKAGSFHAFSISCVSKSRRVICVGDVAMCLSFSDWGSNYGG